MSESSVLLPPTEFLNEITLKLQGGKRVFYLREQDDHTGKP